MPREFVSRERLMEILNAELAEHDVCEDCHFEGPLRQLGRPDDESYNWSQIVALRGQAVEPCRPVAEQIIRQVGERYNVDWAHQGG